MEKANLELSVAIAALTCRYISRWRPPRPKSSAYITPEAYRNLQYEFHSLWKRRAEVTIALFAAAAEGDRSEDDNINYPQYFD